MRGKFVVIDGLDKVGKTTLINKLKTAFEEFVFVSDPSKISAKSIREILLNDSSLNWETKTALFIAARKELLEKEILPELAKGKTVIADRYWGSTYAYQGIVLKTDKKSRKEKTKMIKRLHKIMGVNKKPDCEIILLSKKPFNTPDALNAMDNYCSDNRIEIERNFINYSNLKHNDWPFHIFYVDEHSEENIYSIVKEIILKEIKPA